ncbi:hypothetical protein [Streptomyces fuscigenes]|uniref:hypothetical protein n=1 Tax=Streptomyces fuscigenes TaxID=1528880 RepID=UPI001F38E5E0|nr:hypothetical protein [Streptomyces fuscigenes]MCF3961666.1 hypothetical protein [Streptomyces fuscigenes]
MITTTESWPVVSATLQAKTDQAIVVTGAKISVLSQGPLPKRGMVVDVTGCGSGLDPRAFDLDLRTSPAILKPTIEHTAQGGTVKSRNFPFKVSSGDPEQFAFNVRHVTGDVRFAITLTWVSDGEPGTTRLDNGGRGYRVMSLPKNLPHYSFAEFLNRK